MKLTLGRKLGFGFGVILFLMVLSAVLTYVKASDIKETQELITGIRVPTIGALKDLQRELNQTQSKGRQAILAGNDSSHWEAAKKAFDTAWDDIGKDVAQLEELAPRWTEQANRDRFAEIKKQLVILRETQEPIIKQAASGERDAVIKAGSEYAAKATPVTEAIKKPLGEMADNSITNI
jgi:CHASE3 domain sensor protein